MTISLSDYETGAKYDGDYSDDLAVLEDRLERLQAAHIIHGQRSVIMFEGWDAAGKGGIIRRLTASLDPRVFEVWPISAPNDEEKARHFLWRFWKRLPGNREISVFDRSWYGRVLVERVEGYASEAEWRKGYDRDRRNVRANEHAMGAVEGDRRQPQEDGAHRGADPYRRNARGRGADDPARSRSRRGQTRGQSVRLQAQGLGFSARSASNFGLQPLDGTE